MRMSKPIARLTTPAQMVASLPLWLGYVPTESLVVVCCHEPRGRMGLTVRHDLPAPEHEQLLVEDVVRRVRQQQATRVLVGVYTAEEDGDVRPRTALIDGLRAGLADLTVTEAVLVRDGRFWSYLCSRASCCPPEGTPVDEARDSSAIRLIEAERVFDGRYVLPDREALEASLAGPTFLQAQVALQRCEIAATLLADSLTKVGRKATGELSLQAWWEVVDRWRTPPAQLSTHEAASLAVSLSDPWVRDQLAAAGSADVAPLLSLLAELCRRTPPPYDAAVCTLFAWVKYSEGAGAEVTIALERALGSDPDYRLAQLLMSALQGQVDPKALQRITSAGRRLYRAS